jgi:hypothetical protein
MLLSRHPWLFNGGKYEAKIPPWIFSGLQKRFALLHVAKRPPWLIIGWQVRAKNPSVDFLGIGAVQ